MNSSSLDLLPKICVIYAGGTMGSKQNDAGLLAPATLSEFEQRARNVLDVARIAQVEFRGIETPIDSAEASPSDWLRVRDALQQAWHLFDGFVVVYGTDTLPYVAAFLSFAIEYQDKPVVVTGSMAPIFVDGDALANLKASILVAASSTVDGGAIDQVLVCLGGRILRGNRTAKVSSSADAMASPRAADLGTFQVTGPGSGFPWWYSGFPKKVVRPTGNVKFPDIQPSHVVLLRLFPGISPDLINACCENSQGVVVEAYGSGTGSSKIREVLEALAAKGKSIVVTTDVIEGETQTGRYATDLVPMGSPLILGKRLLTETAVAKLYYFLGILDRECANWASFVKRRIEESNRGDNGEN